MSYRTAIQPLSDHALQSIPVSLEVLALRAAMRKVVLAPRVSRLPGRSEVRMCTHCGSVPAMSGSSVCYQCNSD